MPPEIEPEITEQDTKVTVEEAVSEGIETLLSEEPEEEKENEQAPDEGNAAEAAAPDSEENTEEQGTTEEAGEAAEPLTLDYSVPEGLNERSTARFNSLVEDNKVSRETIAAHEETLNGMRNMVTASGLTNDEYVGAIDFAAEVKRDPAKGIKKLQSYMEHLSKVNGIPIEHNEVDMLEDFPELRRRAFVAVMSRLTDSSKRIRDRACAWLRRETGQRRIPLSYPAWKSWFDTYFEVEESYEEEE